MNDEDVLNFDDTNGGEYSIVSTIDSMLEDLKERHSKKRVYCYESVEIDIFGCALKSVTVSDKALEAYASYKQTGILHVGLGEIIEKYEEFLREGEQ